MVLGFPVPADVAVVLGWNRLQAGERAVEPTPEQAPDATGQIGAAAVAALPDWLFAEEGDANSTTMAGAASSPVEVQEDKSSDSVAQPHQVPEDGELLAVRKEFERLAKRFKASGLERQDRRYPIYVVFSVRRRLEAVYGKKNTAMLEAEMMRLTLAVQSRHGWGARLFFADDPAFTSPLGIRPARPGDAWELKLALADLDAALSKRGEMIGAVLIVGGPEIVPFHCLPNPVDDQDGDVPSDNPYATRDENYFLPEWPVGRLPGGDGNDPRLLLEALRRFSATHAAQARRKPWLKRLWHRLTAWLRRFGGRRASFGYTAAIWKKAATSVFRTIGEPRKLLISPPLGVDDTLGKPKRGGKGVPVPSGRLGYFNLHGLVDAVEWYGHRDPFDPSDGPDYPIALRPQDISPKRRYGKNGVPQVIFSEACYGLHIQARSLEQAISLKFLEAGSLAVAGSTCMAYGSIGAPLIAADLLGQSFWKFLKQGLPAGDALRQAKLHLASEMHRRQGYLDGEDQKTLISFVLYGDPLAQAQASRANPKSIRYREQPLEQVVTVCDRQEESVASHPIPAEVVTSVRQVVAQYLPGMSDAKLALADEREVCQGISHTCPTSQLSAKGTGVKTKAAVAKNGKVAKHAHRLVTLCKQTSDAQGVHQEYARLTLDAQGNLVKLVVSR
jgi:hypothetical protein